MPHIVQSPEAVHDLEEIWLRSFKKWGEYQADKYYDELVEHVDRLKDNPKIGKSRDYIRKDYRSFQVNRHVGTSKNSGFCVSARKRRTENRSIHRVYEDSSTALTQQSRKKRVFRGAHVIYYRLYGEVIDIVRVLHERMDATRHL